MWCTVHHVLYCTPLVHCAPSDVDLLYICTPCVQQTIWCTNVQYIIWCTVHQWCKAHHVVYKCTVHHLVCTSSVQYNMWCTVHYMLYKCTVHHKVCGTPHGVLYMWCTVYHVLYKCAVHHQVCRTPQGVLCRTSMGIQYIYYMCVKELTSARSGSCSSVPLCSARGNSHSGHRVSAPSGPAYGCCPIKTKQKQRNNSSEQRPKERTNQRTKYQAYSNFTLIHNFPVSKIKYMDGV